MSKNLIKVLSIFISFCLILEQSVFAQAIDLSHYFARNSGQTIPQSDKFRPLHLRYLGYDNLNQDFKLLLDKGDTKKEDLENKTYIEENTQTLLKYFFIGLTLPNEKFWVNLRPDSPDNILDPDLEKTDIGRIFLEADLQLKKDTASWTSPQTPEGKAYWDKLYKKAGELFGTENITIPTLTRPWIVPGEIIIRETIDSAYIYKATLKVMLEEDYLKSPSHKVTRSPNNQPLTSNYNFSDPRLKELNQYSTQLIKELIIPKLIQEINSSKRYAPLRQVYYSLILAQWFKARFADKNTVYSRLINQKDFVNLRSKGQWDKLNYFKDYQKSFKNGEYKISEPVYTPSGQTIRSYFSGGISVMSNSPLVEELKRPIGATDNKAVLSAAASPALSGHLFPKVYGVAGQVDVFTQSLESEEDFGGTMGRWKYAYATFDADGKLTLHNATRIPTKKSVVEEEFLIDGQNKPRDIVLQTRPLNSAEQEKISAEKQELKIITESRVIVRDESAIKHRIYGFAEPFEIAGPFFADYVKRESTDGVTSQGILFIREDIIAEGNRNQIEEALDHENRELTSKRHDEIKTQQFQGGLRRLIKILSDRDKINYGWSNMLSREGLPTITQQTELAPTIRANPPVAGSFLIADLKFTPEGKVKILEFGNGLNSGFVGYDALYDVDMRTLFWNHLVSLGLPIWFINENEELRPSVSRNIVRMSSWEKFKDAVEKGAWGQRKTNFDPNDHSTYSGIIVIGDPITYRRYEPLQDLLKRNPWLFPFSGGGAAFEYAEDKFLTATLFSDDLQDYFPKWRVFPKEYRAGFAEEIISDMPSKKYVIKPLWSGDPLGTALTGIDTGATRGNGVLVVEAAQLDSTLRQIFGVDQRKEFKRIQKEELRLPNPSKYPHEYWLLDQSPVFLIETFEEGKRIFVKGQNYDPTARIAFLLSYNKGKASIDVLDGYYKLPPKSVNEAEGRDTSISKIVEGQESSVKISGEQKADITQQLKSFLPQIYQKMISSNETTAIDSLLSSDRIEYIVYGIHLLRESKKVLPHQAERLKFLASLHNKVLDLSLLDLIQRMYFFSQKQDIPIEFMEALVASEAAEVRDGILELSLENNLTNILLSFQNDADKIQDQKLKSEYLVYLYKKGVIQKVVLFKGIESIFNENEIGAQQFILEYLVENEYIFQAPWIFDYLKKDRSSLLFAHWGSLFNAQRHKLENQADNNNAKAIIYEYDRVFSEMSPAEVAKLLQTLINKQDFDLIEWCWKFAQDLADRINDTKFSNLVKEPEHLMAWAWGREFTDVFRYLGDKVNQFLSKEDSEADRGSSSSIMPKIDSSLNTPGGIDFRTLPIVTQAISNLSLNALPIPLNRLDSINLNQEWRQIQKMAEVGIAPSTERIKEYIQLSCLSRLWRDPAPEFNYSAGKGEFSDTQKVISCIADILRSEEERCVSTEPELKDILVVIESGRSAQELKAIFTGSRT